MHPKISLNAIQFPVYVIGRKPPITDNGVSYFVYGKDTKYSDAEYYVSILDDKNHPGATLAMRRLMLAADGVKLKSLTKAIFFMSDFIKIAQAGVYFIDSSGAIFNYAKTTPVPLVYKKVSKVIPMPHGGAIVEVDGVPSRFKTLFVPDSDKKYAGILVHNMGHILYGMYNKKYKDTFRRI